MNKPLITIITVCYNASKYIEKTILSVINQTYSNIEYVIIDGGSSDGTIDIIKKYSKHITFWVSEPDKGIYDAMNKGIKHASGEWINFMNCGDTFTDNNVIETIFENNIYKGVKVIYGNIVWVNHNTFTQQKAYPLKTISYRMPFCHQASFIKTSYAKQNLFNTKFKIASDYHCMHTLYYNHGEKAFYYIDLYIANFDLSDSFSINNSYKHWLEYIEIRSSHKDFRWYYDYIKKQIKVLLKYSN